jgi:glucose-6-phosphate-specific signal transduction histidine kinase
VITALLILVPVVAIATWAFLRYSRRRGDGQAIRWINLTSLAAALLLAVAWSVRTYAVMSATIDAPWWPIISLLGALVIIPLVLGVAGVVRHVVRGRRRGAGLGPSASEHPRGTP